MKTLVASPSPSMPHLEGVIWRRVCWGWNHVFLRQRERVNVCFVIRTCSCHMSLALVDAKSWRLWVVGQAKCVEPTDALIPADPAAVAWTKWLQEGSDLLMNLLFSLHELVYVWMSDKSCLHLKPSWSVGSSLNCITSLRVVSWNWFYFYMNPGMFENYCFFEASWRAVRAKLWLPQGV